MRANLVQPLDTLRKRVRNPRKEVFQQQCWDILGLETMARRSANKGAGRGLAGGGPGVAGEANYFLQQLHPRDLRQNTEARARCHKMILG